MTGERLGISRSIQASVINSVWDEDVPKGWLRDKERRYNMNEADSVHTHDVRHEYS